METEIEAKFINIDCDAFRKKLTEVGAKLIYPERFMKRRTYDDAGGSLRKIGGWVRVRHEGDVVTLSYKQLNDRTLHGTKEVTVEVNDFEKTCEFMKAIGFVEKSYQETKREKWIHDGAEVTIDTWPWIPTFVEIEAKDEDHIKNISARLGFDWKDALHGSVENAYMAVYDVTEDEIDDWKEILFSSVPEWLEIKRKK